MRDRPGGAIDQLEAGYVGTRLGEGLGSGGALVPAAVERTLAAVDGFLHRVRAFEAGLVTIATSAVRRADDGPAFARRMRERTGVELQILDGRVEAEASFRGATYGAPPGGRRIAVVDVGGGSTECAVGRAGELEAARSVEVGSVRLSERFPELLGAAAGSRAVAAAAAARAELATLLAPFAALGPVDEARCVAGTPLTLAAVARGTHVEAISNGTTLSRAALDATVERLLGLDLASRRALPGMVAQRADVIAGGGLVLSEALLALGCSQARLEENDLLLGFLLMQRKQ